MALGLDRREAMDLPIGEILDLFRIHMIRRGAAKEKTETNDEEVFPDLR